MQKKEKKLLEICTKTLRTSKKLIRNTQLVTLEKGKEITENLTEVKFRIPKRKYREKPQDVIIELSDEKNVIISSEKVSQHQRKAIYNMMGENNGKYRKKNEENEYSLNYLGRNRISQIFSIGLNAYKKLNFTPIDNIFTHTTSHIREKCISGEILTTEEIGELFNEITEYTKEKKNTKDKKSNYNERSGHKSLFSTLLYTMRYMGEKYNYFEVIESLGEDIEENLRQSINKKMKEGIGENFGFNSNRLKGLFSLGLKAARGKDDIGDLLGGRTTFHVNEKKTDQDRKKLIKNDSI